MPRLAVIDIGTHSALLLIANVINGQVTPLLDEARTTHLGAGLKLSGKIEPTAQARLMTVLVAYEAILSEYEVDQVICYGTAAFRYADNAAACQQQIQQAFGWPVRILSGQEEAAFTFRGALQTLRTLTPKTGEPSSPVGQNTDQTTLAIDIGGGSTEVIWGSSNSLKYSCSLSVGAVLLQEQFSLGDQLAAAQEQAIDAFLDLQFQAIELPDSPGLALVTGGTATTLAALLLELTVYDLERIDGVAIACPQIEMLYTELNQLSLAQRADLPGMEAGRATVILPALRLLLRLMVRLRCRQITVTVRGARYGILEDQG